MELVTIDQGEASSTQITLEEAKEIALKDAGLTKDAVTFTTAKLDSEDGIAIYDLEFYSENVEYEYEINANTGAIFSKSKETVVTQNEQKPEASTNQPTAEVTDTKENTDFIKQSDTDSKSNTNSKSDDGQTESGKQKNTDKQITLDAAKAKALADAGVSASKATFTKAKLDKDDGVAVYEIEFYTSTHEYEYEINAVTGVIHDKSVESLKKISRDDQDEDQDKDKDEDDDDDEDGDIRVGSSNVSNSKSDTYIGIDKAKSIAVSHAGFAKSEVTFSKAKLDKDDGKSVYEIEFFKNGTEYEYEIDASSGKILEVDSERDDD